MKEKHSNSNVHMVKGATNSLPLSKRIQRYTYAVKYFERSEVYETLLLMFLNNDLIIALDKIIDESMKNLLVIKDKLTIQFYPSKEYQIAVKDVCKSKYFKENFSKYEIRRREKIMENILMEIVTQVALVEKLGISRISVNNQSDYPLIKHKIIKKSNLVSLSFDQETSIKEIVSYCEKVLRMKNHPKKRKLSLGKGYRLMMIDDLIREKADKKSGSYTYIEELTKNEYNNKYGENLTIEDVQKSLHRIRKIKSEINN